MRYRILSENICNLLAKFCERISSRFQKNWRTDRQTNKQTNRKKDRQTNKQKDYTSPAPAGALATIKMSSMNDIKLDKVFKK